MDDERRAILEAVAAGTLSPEEAAERLAGLEEHTQVPPADEAVRGVRIVTAGHPVRVLPDAAVAAASVEGPHRLRREGATLVVEPELSDAAASSVSASRPRSGQQGPWLPPLTVYIRPDLALHADVTATSLTVRDIGGPITLRLSSGSATVTGFTRPIDMTVSAGSVSASGVLDGGESRLRCDGGSIRLDLGTASSVRIEGGATAGRLALAGVPGRHRGARPGRRHETVVGEGAGHLDVEVTAGSVVIEAGGTSWAASAARS